MPHRSGKLRKTKELAQDFVAKGVVGFALHGADGSKVIQAGATARRSAYE